MIFYYLSKFFFNYPPTPVPVRGDIILIENGKWTMENNENG